MEPVEFFLAISSALDVFRWSIRRFGMLKGGTFILSDENWCLNGRWRSGDGNDKLSNFNLLRCCRSMQSSISCRTLMSVESLLFECTPAEMMNEKSELIFHTSVVHTHSPRSTCQQSNWKNVMPTHLEQYHELFQVERRIHGLRYQRWHHSSRHHVYTQSVLLVAQHYPIDVCGVWEKSEVR